LKEKEPKRTLNYFYFHEREFGRSVQKSCRGHDFSVGPAELISAGGNHLVGRPYTLRQSSKFEVLFDPFPLKGRIPLGFCKAKSSVMTVFQEKG
jgi:hypothetical protein